MACQHKEYIVELLGEIAGLEEEAKQTQAYSFELENKRQAAESQMALLKIRHARQIGELEKTIDIILERLHKHDKICGKKCPRLTGLIDTASTDRADAPRCKTE